MERISNHIGDCSALAHDVGLNVIASDVSMLRERMLELCLETAGHRLLMGINQPGGVILSDPVDPIRVGTVVQVIIEEFLSQCHMLGQNGLWKDRTQGVGVLEMRKAQKLDTTGMVARSSGILRDFRLNHPDNGGIYNPPGMQQLFHEKYGQPLFNNLLTAEVAINQISSTPGSTCNKLASRSTKWTSYSNKGCPQERKAHFRFLYPRP